MKKVNEQKNKVTKQDIEDFNNKLKETMRKHMPKKYLDTKKHL